MAWPTTAVVTGDLVTTLQLNALPVRIADTTLGADAASITFSSIPQVYAHLILVGYFRSSFAAASSSVALRFNNDTAANYDYQLLYGSAAALTSGEAFALTNVELAWEIPANTAGANLFSGGSAFIPHYANTANNKVIISAGGVKTGTSTTNMKAKKYSGFWRSSAAITRIDLLEESGGNFKSGSRATLYGLP